LSIPKGAVQQKKEKLEAAGWKVVEVFECDLKKDKQEQTIKKIIKDIKSNFYD